MRKDLGPISMSFEIPMYNVSQLQVQHLKIVERNKSYNPHRWVRYPTRALRRRATPNPNPEPDPEPTPNQVRCLTHAESYVCRV